MIYGLKWDLDGKVITIPILSVTEQKDVMTFNSFLASSDLLEAVSNEGVSITFVADKPSQVAGVEALVYPSITSAPENALVVVTPIYNMYRSDNNFSDYEGLHKKYAEVNFDIATSVIENIFKSFREMTTYLERKATFILDIPSYFFDNISVKSVADIYNSKRTAKLSFISNGLNRTTKNENEYDPFFVEIPLYELLVSDDSINSLIPSPNELTEPYPHPIFHLPHAAYSIDFTRAERDRYFLANMKQGGAVQYSIRDYDIQSIPTIPKKHLLGSSSNNTIGILDHEKDYYNALKEYCLYDIKQNYPDADAEELYKKGTLSPRMELYLTKLVHSFAEMNWTHNNKISISSASMLDEDDDDDIDPFKESSGKEDQANFDDNIMFIFPTDDSTPAGLVRKEGKSILNHFIAKAKDAIGNDAYIIAIIKLARWGELKPSVLVIEGYDTYLDMNTMTPKKTTGDISCLKEVDYNGHKYQIASFVLNSVIMNDKEYLQTNKYRGSYENVIGMGLVLHLEDNNHRVVYMSIIDIVREYKQDPECKLIYGINYNNGLFSGEGFDAVPQEYLMDVVRKVNNSQDSMYSFEGSEECNKLEINPSVKRGVSVLESIYYVLSQQGIMSMMYNEVKVGSIIKAVDVAPKNSLLVSDVIRINSFNEIVKVLEKVEDVVGENEVDIINLLNTYTQAIDSTEFNNEFQFLEDFGGKAEPVMKTEGTMLNSFNTIAPKSADLSGQLRDLMLEDLKPGVIVKKLVWNEIIIAGIQAIPVEGGKPYYILSSPSKVTTDSAVNGALIVPLLLTNFGALMSNANIRAKFTSVAEMGEIISLIGSATSPKKTST